MTDFHCDDTIRTDDVLIFKTGICRRRARVMRGERKVRRAHFQTSLENWKMVESYSQNNIISRSTSDETMIILNYLDPYSLCNR